MENAAKALLIAGGILLAILITGLLVLLAGNLTSYNEANANKEVAKQLAEFNKQYESYNKKLLYGTDVITLVNKAIENNKKMETINDINSRYYVNVVIITNNEYKTTVQKSWYDLKEKRNKTEDVIDENKQKIIKKLKDDYGITISDEKVNLNTKLGEWDYSDKLKMNKGVISFFEQEAKDVTVDIDGYTYNIYSALNVFKKSIFKCEKIEYLDGRVHEITFKEIK